MRDDNAWFVPKRYGYGAGLPIAWQGWALLGGFSALVIAASAVLGQGHPALLVAFVVALTIPLVIVCARHTRGGWRWGGPE